MLVNIHQRLLAIKLQNNATCAFRRASKINQPDPSGILTRLRYLTPGCPTAPAVSRHGDHRIQHQGESVIRGFRYEPDCGNQIDDHSRALLILGNQDVLDRPPAHIDH